MPADFSPITPEGIVALAVPAEVIQPGALYRVSPRNQGRGDIFAVDVPQPAASKLRGRGYRAPSQATPHEPATYRSARDGEITFDSTDFDANSDLTGGWLFIPPDPIAAAGPAHLVNVVNVAIRFHLKDGTLTFESSLADFFAALSPDTFTFDPKVIYDQYACRFVVVTLEQLDTDAGDPVDASRILVAVSDDDDPNGTWYMTSIDSKLSFYNETWAGTIDHWADYPGLAIDDAGIYLTANMFGFGSTGGPYGGSRLWVVEKGLGTGGLYDNGVANVSLYDPYTGAGTATTTMPTHTFGTTPGSTAIWLVSYSGLTDGADEYVQSVRLDSPSSPVFTQSYINVGDLEDFSSGSLPNAPQAGSAVDIETNDRRMLHAVWRDDILTGVVTIDPKAGDADSGEATAHWFQLATDAAGDVSILDQGSIGGEDIASGTSTFFPSVAVNADGVTVVGFSASAVSMYCGCHYAVRLPGDPVGTVGASQALRAGVDWYERTFSGTSNRWGDYSGVAVDPADGCFWIYNEYAITRGSATPDGDGRWGTAYGRWCSELLDCNDNGIADDLDLANCDGSPWCDDCNQNARLDVCDISAGTSEDCNSNGVPDECEVGSSSITISFPLDSDPGWSTERLWAYGQPTGGGGQYGHADPTSGHTGANVYGYNLSGDYENNLPETHLTTTAIDCSDLQNVRLKFWRWLNVEQSSYDHAYIRVSNDGSSWTTIFSNPDWNLEDSSWSQLEYDISAVADNQATVYIRWTMGTTDSAWQFSGWNIDDVEIVGDSAGGGTGDCNDNGILDECDISAGTSEDCNGNGVPDECDIADGASDDCDGNGVPDECDGDPYAVYVDAAWLDPCELGTPEFPFNTVSEGNEAAASDGAIMSIQGGTYAETVTFTKSLRIESDGGLVRIAP